MNPDLSQVFSDNRRARFLGTTTPDAPKVPPSVAIERLIVEDLDRTLADFCGYGCLDEVALADGRKFRAGDVTLRQALGREIRRFVAILDLDGSHFPATAKRFPQ